MRVKQLSLFNGNIEYIYRVGDICRIETIVVTPVNSKDADTMSGQVYVAGCHAKIVQVKGELYTVELLTCTEIDGVLVYVDKDDIVPSSMNELGCCYYCKHENDLNGECWKNHDPYMKCKVEMHKYKISKNYETV